MAKIIWRKSRSFRPELLLEKLDSQRTNSPHGRMAISGMAYEELLPALHTMMQLSKPVDGVNVQSILFKALLRAPVPLTSDGFLESANDLLKEFLSVREVEYRVLTTLSVSCSTIPSTVRIDGVKIDFLKGDFPRKYQGRSDLIKMSDGSDSDAPMNFTRVVISVKAKSPAAAIHKGLRALDLQRALWCLFWNFAFEINIGRRIDTPINVIRLGEHHTVHLANGAAAGQTVWYEPNFSAAKVFSVKSPTTVHKNCVTQRLRLKKAAYSEKLSAALLRYVRALDERDMNSAFLRLWSVLETLTGDGAADHEKLVQRCSFLFKDRDFHL